MTVSVADDLFYYVGEKPPPLPFRYEDDDGVLDASIAGATITLLVNTEGSTASELPVTCSNTGDGSGTIDWPTGTSAFTLDADVDEGTMRCDMKVVAAPQEWFMDRFSFPIRRRK